MAWRRGARLAATVLVGLTTVSAAAVQRGGGFFNQRSLVARVEYNGKFTFTRLRYNGGLRGGGFGWGSSAWNHDYPQADMHLPKILESLTAIEPNLDVSNILDLEDPEIFKNPILYMWEPGGWQISDQGAKNLRDFMLKGGFVVFDDFEANQWFNFEEQFLRAMPEAQFIQLETSHRVFHAFFDLDELNLPHPSVNVTPAFIGVFEDNDPDKRMMALVCYNSDVAEYWEWSASGMFPVDTTNDAYKLGINYMIYAMMH
jgi:Domain of unknown function (DUF4159)